MGYITAPAWGAMMYGTVRCPCGAKTPIMIKDFTVCFSCGQVLTLPIWYSEEYKRAIRSMNDIRT
ncbi:hypothetical protein ABTB94_20525, partial [Acinetobacter baumannii]